jgi:arylsulfatase A-like enzyme
VLSDDAATFASVGDRFDSHVEVPYDAASRSADSIEGTQLFRFFAALGDMLSDAASVQGAKPFFIWAQARGMNATWDAPYAMRRLILDEDDPDPPRDVSFAARRLAVDVDPDELLGLRAAYAGQIGVLDECLAALDDLLDETGLAENTTVALVGVRGFPLGEHGAFGLEVGQLHEELLHVPWILRFPGDAFAALRLPQLVTHVDLGPTLADACGFSPTSDVTNDLGMTGASLMPLLRDERGPWRDHVCHRLRDEVGITTPAWRLRKVDDAVQLFVKPDDRWEVNDVSQRCGDVAERLVAAMGASFESAERGAAPPVLDEVLRDGL